MKRTEQCVLLGHDGDSQRLHVPDETGYALWNASAYGVFMASSITVAVMHALCMLVWKDWNFLLASKRKWHCLQAANTSACWFSRFCAWHGPNRRLQTSTSCFICPYFFFLLFVFIKTLTVFLSSTTQRPLWRPLPKGKDQNRSFCPGTNYMHSRVEKDVVSLNSQAFLSFCFFPLVLWLKWLEEC